MNPMMEFLGTLQKSRFWWVKVQSKECEGTATEVSGKTCAPHGAKMLSSLGLYMATRSNATLQQIWRSI